MEQEELTKIWEAIDKRSAYAFGGGGRWGAETASGMKECQTAVSAFNA